MFSTSANFTTGTYVNQDNAGDVTGILNLKFTPQTSPSPIGSAGIWENTDGDLYFNGINLSSGGSGGVVPPLTQTPNTIPTWAGSGNALLNGTVDINSNANIGSVYPPSSLSLHSTSSTVASPHTIWCDSTNASALSYDAANVVTFPKSSSAQVTGLATFNNTQGSSIGSVGFVMPNFNGLTQNVLISNPSSALQDGAMETSVVIGTQMSNHCSVSLPLSTSSQNVMIGNAVGNGLGKSLSNRGGNVMIGQDIGVNDGGSNVCIGNNILSSGVTFVTVNDNIALGTDALSQSEGSRNIAIGTGSGADITGTATNDNIFIGYHAGSLAPYSSANIVVGGNSANAASAASGFGSNIIVGNNTFNNATIGGLNTIVGNTAATSLSSGAYNVLYGAGTGNGLTTGSNNVIIGNTNGGYQGLTTGSHNILIESAVTNPGATGAISIGNAGTHVQAFIAGIYGTDVGVGEAVYINSSGQLGTATALMRRAKLDELAVTEFTDLSESFINKSLGNESNTDEELRKDLEVVKTEIEVLKKRLDTLSTINATLFRKLTGANTATI